MCLVLRQLGHLVQANWDEWFNRVALPRIEPEPQEPASEETDEGEEGEEEPEVVLDSVDEITELVDLLVNMVGDPFTYAYNHIQSVYSVN